MLIFGRVYKGLSKITQLFSGRPKCHFSFFFFQKICAFVVARFHKITSLPVFRNSITIFAFQDWDSSRIQVFYEVLIKSQNSLVQGSINDVLK